MIPEGGPGWGAQLGGSGWGAQVGGSGWEGPGPPAAAGRLLHSRNSSASHRAPPGAPAPFQGHGAHSAEADAGTGGQESVPGSCLTESKNEAAGQRRSNTAGVYCHQQGTRSGRGPHGGAEPSASRTSAGAAVPLALLSDRVPAWWQHGGWHSRERPRFQAPFSCPVSYKRAVVPARSGPLLALPLPPTLLLTPLKPREGGPRCRRPRHPAEASRLVLAVPLLACSPTVFTWRPPTRRCPSVLPLQKAAPREELPLCIPARLWACTQ